ncbi:hypothetical protein VM1G_03303 [Cytospora mali]|uniref:BTB domain-containing protein n=1 Tax=Cytospora mali TaxID=578113 RepID=A0A194VTE9_CYTMA|nr:hypothetical protein VM1G_03303 [Valsa mali]
MSSTHDEMEQRLGTDGLEDRLERPRKRRMTDKSSPGTSSTAAVANASASSVFGGVPGPVNMAAMDAVGTVAGSADGTDDGGTERKGTMSDKSKSAETEVPQVDRLFSDRVVTILVGPRGTKWCLHENLLSGVSDFFKAAFNSGFKESLEGKMAMPEDDPYAFELFVRWLYIRTVMPEAVTCSRTTANALLSRHFTTGVAAPCIRDYLHLYVLASKLLIEDLENACVGMVYAYYGEGMRRPGIKDVQYIYDNTMPGSGMRKLLRERLALGLFRGRQNNPVTAGWREIMNETPDLGFDVVSEIASYSWIAGGNAPVRQVAEECAYHRHEKSEVCPRL